MISEQSKRTILVTGCAGFIGFHLAKRLLEDGESAVGVDNLNEYFSVDLKCVRLRKLRSFDRFAFEDFHLANDAETVHLFQRFDFERAIHLAAQAGVRYSIDNPKVYLQSNLVATGNILEGCRHHSVKHPIYASSSSSACGANTRQPFSVHDNVDHAISLYAATKKSNELIAHC
ncbi:UDP-glucose 4-epimerase [Crateriforma conspicua]|nr:GDP-mannose 4,6-dehydratase [Crateriforma conspicua]QDV65133.1 UDP-glucose 4-epimerase [Crateriforma conspicua]